MRFDILYHCKNLNKVIIAEINYGLQTGISDYFGYYKGTEREVPKESWGTWPWKRCCWNIKTSISKMADPSGYGLLKDHIWNRKWKSAWGQTNAQVILKKTESEMTMVKSHWKLKSILFQLKYKKEWRNNFSGNRNPSSISARRMIQEVWERLIRYSWSHRNLSLNVTIISQKRGGGAYRKWTGQWKGVSLNK